MIVLRLARTRPSCLRHSWIASSHISNHVRSLATIAQDTKHFKISNQVRNALEKNLPVVALETAIYTHGFPYPDNVALASELESAIRAEGVIPATIGILDGVARVGLNADELTRLCQTPRQELMKVSRRDLSLISSINQGLGGSHYEKRSGGTTVAGTMVLAHKAGIRVFATGGIGGVHKGAETTFDISADLVELGRTPVAVVCSGCKSFLDVPKTLEYLETQGVPVATLKSSQGLDEFPGFWSVGSGVKSPAIWDALPINAANAICKCLIGFALCLLLKLYHQIPIFRLALLLE
jgi:pseudouridine-5'-phosphate glycosidase/pseudouridine kinase